MKPSTADNLLHLVGELELVPSAALNETFSEAGGHALDAAAFGQALVRRELVTGFQLERLLRGERGGYYFGRAKILYQIGAGSFARVYRAIHRDTGVLLVNVEAIAFRYLIAGPADVGALAELMAVGGLDDGTPRLHQRPDPMINNLIGIVHGGVSSAGLELAASAAINHEQDDPLRTASIRVNFLRPFLAGAQSVYEGTALRIGRSMAVGDARAVGDDGKVAVVARITGYR